MTRTLYRCDMCSQEQTDIDNWFTVVIERRAEPLLIISPHFARESRIGQTVERSSAERWDLCNGDCLSKLVAKFAGSVLIADVK